MKLLLKFITFNSGGSISNDFWQISLLIGGVAFRPACIFYYFHFSFFIFLQNNQKIKTCAKKAQMQKGKWGYFFCSKSLVTG